VREPDAVQACQDTDHEKARGGQDISHKQLLASIALAGEGFIREIKQRPDVHLLEVTLANRDRLPDATVEGCDVDMIRTFSPFPDHSRC